MSEQQEQLEYNDGLGDLLREKEKREFSWTKTSIVLLIVIFGIFIGLTFIFNFSKAILTKEASPKSSVKSSEISGVPAVNDDDFQDKIKKIEKENLALIKSIQTDLDNKQALSQKRRYDEKTAAKSTDTSKKSTSAAPAKASTSSSIYKVIAGSYSTYDNAKAQQVVLKSKNIDNFIKPASINGKTWYRIQVGAFKKEAQAKTHQSDLKKKGITTTIVAE